MSNPLFWFSALMLFGYLRKKKKLMLFTCLGLYILSLPIFSSIVLKWWESETELNQSKYTYGVVLGGMSGMNRNTKSIQFSQASDRLWQALKQLNKGTIDTLIISGGAGSILDTTEYEAQFILDYLNEIGLNTSKIKIEYNSKNTYQNALESKKLMNKDINESILLFTSAFHLPRAKKCFEKQNLKVDVFACDQRSGDQISFNMFIIPTSGSLQTWGILLHEWVGYLAYRIKGYI